MRSGRTAGARSRPPWLCRRCCGGWCLAAPRRPRRSCRSGRRTRWARRRGGRPWRRRRPAPRGGAGARWGQACWAGVGMGGCCVVWGCSGVDWRGLCGLFAVFRRLRYFAVELQVGLQKAGGFRDRSGYKKLEGFATSGAAGIDRLSNSIGGRTNFVGGGWLGGLGRCFGPSTEASMAASRFLCTRCMNDVKATASAKATRTSKSSSTEALRPPPAIKSLPSPLPSTRTRDECVAMWAPQPLPQLP